MSNHTEHTFEDAIEHGFIAAAVTGQIEGLR